MRIAPIRAALTVALLVILAVPASASELPPPLSDEGVGKEVVSQVVQNFQIHPPNNGGGYLGTRPREVLGALADEE